MEWKLVAGGAVAVFALAWAGTGAVLRVLRHRAVLDHPNARSSHAVPTPRGAGLAVVPLVLLAWAAAHLYFDPLPAPWAVLIGALFLAAVSWLDDLHGLAPPIRLIAQIAAISVGMTALPDEARLFQGLLPRVPDLLAGAVVWLWFVNLFNFMDGIDGLAGTETVCIGLGLGLLLPFAGLAPGLAPYAVAVAAAALGFLAWNWQPARIFLGDVGSVPLGYLLGWLLLATAAAGGWAAALILPLYYLADASLTLALRIRRGERVWEAHAKHFYQHALRGGLTHAAVVRRVLVVNLGLVALAGVALAGHRVAALIAAGLLVAGLLVHFRRVGARGA
ncbi:MAG: MraY family glycosyltransferase [Alphaproteobacteria bacterium]